MLPWVLEGGSLAGEVLEIGAGSGAMAVGVARSFPQAHLTVTDIDPAMVTMAEKRLANQKNTVAEQADVTNLDYETDSFDSVASWLMLHHVIAWPAALAEAVRVLKPGGEFVGYDLTDTAFARGLHRIDGSPHLMIAPDEFADELKRVGFRTVEVETSARGHLMRFRATK